MKSLEKKKGSLLAIEKSTDNPLKDHKEVKSFEERFGHTHTHTKDELKDCPIIDRENKRAKNCFLKPFFEISRISGPQEIIPV